MIKKLLIRFLAASARRILAREKPLIVGITGSYGKSSAKEAIAIALGAMEPGSLVRSSPKNYNNEFGLPFTILNVSAPGRDPIKWLSVLGRACWMGWGFGRVHVNTFVLEMGADRRGDLKWLVSIARPDISVVTGVGEAHSQYFGTIDEIANEKATLVRALARNGFAILNNDDTRVTAMRRDTDAEALYYGFSDGSDIQILKTSFAIIEDDAGHLAPVGIDVAFACDGQVSELHLRGTIGRPQALAAASALAVARRLEIPLQTALDRLERTYHGIAGRTRIIPGIKGTTIIDDTYNAASAKTVISALHDLMQLGVKGDQRKIAALGEMRELGEYAEIGNQDVGRAVAESGVDFLVTCGTLARGIGDAAVAVGFAPENVRHTENSADAGRFLQEFIKPGDVILAKGSQGIRMERVVKELMAEPNEAPFLLVRMTEDWIGK